MNTNEAKQPQDWQHVRVIKPHQFDSNTPQTPGMQRVTAVSRELAGRRVSGPASQLSHHTLPAQNTITASLKR